MYSTECPWYKPSHRLALIEPETKNSNLIQDIDIGTITVLPSNSSIGHVDKAVGLTLGITLGA